MSLMHSVEYFLSIHEFDHPSPFNFTVFTTGIFTLSTTVSYCDLHVVKASSFVSTTCYVFTHYFLCTPFNLSFTPAKSQIMYTCCIIIIMVKFFH